MSVFSEGGNALSKAAPSMKNVLCLVDARSTDGQHRPGCSAFLLAQTAKCAAIQITFV